MNNLEVQMDYEDDVDVREQMFHNAVREYIVSWTKVHASKYRLFFCFHHFYCLKQRSRNVEFQTPNVLLREKGIIKDSHLKLSQRFMGKYLSYGNTFYRKQVYLDISQKNFYRRLH